MTLKTTSAGSDTSPTVAKRDGGEAGRVARFAVIGGASVATDLSVYALLVSHLDTHPAKGVSYLAGMLVGFVGNKFWSFKSARRTASEPITYGLLYAVTLAVNVLVNGGVLALTEGWGLHPTVRWGLAFLVATGITTVLNYLGLRWVTFRRGVAEREAG